jgi:hypothetical protein
MSLCGEHASISQTQDLNAKQLDKKAAEYYHGSGPVASQLHRFLKGKGVYSNMFDYPS